MYDIFLIFNAENTNIKLIYYNVYKTQNDQFVELVFRRHFMVKKIL